MRYNMLYVAMFVVLGAASVLVYEPVTTIAALIEANLSLETHPSHENVRWPLNSGSLATRGRLFVNTYLVTALNPKGIVFFVAFLPQFVSPNASVNVQLWVLAATFVVMATINTALYAVFAASARRLLTSPRAQRRFNVAGGSLLMVAGVWALLARRPV